MSSMSFMSDSPKKESTKPATTTEEPKEVYEEGVFYYYGADGTSLECTDDISMLPEDTRGFFKKDDTFYFSSVVFLDEESLNNFAPYVSVTPTDSAYSICHIYTYNMIDVYPCEVYDDMYRVYPGDDNILLYVLSSVNNCSDPITVLNDLKSWNISIGYFDPPEIEGPSA